MKNKKGYHYVNEKDVEEFMAKFQIYYMETSAFTDQGLQNVINLIEILLFKQTEDYKQYYIKSSSSKNKIENDTKLEKKKKKKDKYGCC